MSTYYRINVLDINGEACEELAGRTIELEFICRGGFRFLSDEAFELEDRLRVKLNFPDDHSQEVYGRICYYDVIDETHTVYGFSVLDGFYTLHEDAIAA